MDIEHTYSNKKLKKKSNRSQFKKQNNHQNETDEKFVTTTKNILSTKEDINNLQDLSNTFKNLDILISNKLQSLGNNQTNKHTSSSNLIKKQNNILKQKNNFPKQSILKACINKSHTEKSNETFNQSNSLLLNKDIYNCKEQNSINERIKNKKKDSSNYCYLKSVKSSENIRKKTIAKLSSNSISNSCLSKNPNSKKTLRGVLFSRENSYNIISNRILCHPKSEEHIKKINFHEENNSQNKRKNILTKKRYIKNQLKNKLLNDKNNNYPNIIRTAKSLKTPKMLKNDNPLKKRKNTTTNSSRTQASQSNKK